MNLFFMLSLIFMVLKLSHQIDWSWWAVFLPIIVYIYTFLFFAIVNWWKPKTKTEIAIYMLKKYYKDTKWKQ